MQIPVICCGFTAVILSSFLALTQATVGGQYSVSVHFVAPLVNAPCQVAQFWTPPNVVCGLCFCMTGSLSRCIPQPGCNPQNATTTMPPPSNNTEADNNKPPEEGSSQPDNGGQEKPQAPPQGEKPADQKPPPAEESNGDKPPPGEDSKPQETPQQPPDAPTQPEEGNGTPSKVSNKFRGAKPGGKTRRRRHLRK